MISILDSVNGNLGKPSTFTSTFANLRVSVQGLKTCRQKGHSVPKC
jgi:hypothetical protein